FQPGPPLQRRSQPGSEGRAAGVHEDAVRRRRCSAVGYQYSSSSAALPGEGGSTRSSRSRAWITVFSSTQNTAACCGRFKYNPMMSAAFLAGRNGQLVPAAATGKPDGDETTSTLTTDSSHIVGTFSVVLSPTTTSCGGDRKSTRLN